MEKDMDKSTDTAGRAYAKLSVVKPGHILEADGLCAACDKAEAVLSHQPTS